MEGHVVTTNPWLIMAINMTIVFGVLIALGVLMQIIHMVDPTKKKSETVTTPVAAPVATSAPAAPVTSASNDEVVAAITAAVVAMGYSASQIASVRPARANQWTLEGRLSGRM